MKRLLSMMLALVLLVVGVPVTVSAEERETTATKPAVEYGTINVLTAETQQPEPYRAARDAQGNVYIHMGDFARLIRAELVQAGDADTYCYQFGYWNLAVYCRAKAAKLYYNPSGVYGNKGYPLYDVFSFEKVLYNPSKGGWYFPMEEMLYMSLCTWSCQNNFVAAYRPQTILDVIPQLRKLSADNPRYEDLMGDKLSEQWGNACGYAVLASADEMSMTFAWDLCLVAVSDICGALTGREFYDATTYENDVLKETLLLLLDDDPYATTEDRLQTEGNPELAKLKTAVNHLSTVMGVYDGVSQAITIEKLCNLAGYQMDVKQFYNVYKSATDRANTVALAVPFIDICYGTADALWKRGYVTENFEERVEFLQECAAADPENEFARRLKRAAGDAQTEYCSTVKDAVQSQVGFGEIFNTCLAVYNKLPGGTTKGMRWFQSFALAMEVYDLAVETCKLIPSVGEAFEIGENAYTTMNLLNLYTYMGRHSNRQTQALAQTPVKIDRTYLRELRLSCQIAQNAAMHAHTHLQKMGKCQDTSVDAGVVLLQSLTESAKHDGLLAITNDYVDLYSDEAGAVREQIPSEYVCVEDGVFLSPIHQLTEVPEGFTAINNEADFRGIAQNMSGSYILMADVELIEWAPLGNASMPFTGILDGNGYSVTVNSSQHIDFEEDAYGGLFFLLHNATVKNLHVKGKQYHYFQDQKPVKQFFDDIVVGGIAAYAQGTTALFNCVNSTDICFVSNHSTFMFDETNNDLGGMVGTISDYGENVRISFCRNFGALDGDDNVAGIVGDAKHATIYACQNDGTILSEFQAAGIAACSEMYIGSCANRGNINSQDSACGIACRATMIENCINAGSIYSVGTPVMWGGGITCTANGIVKNCVNIGDIGNPGGICRQYGEKAVIENCYWDEKGEVLYAVTYRDDNGGVDASDGKLTATQMTDPYSFVGFDFQGTWVLEKGMRCPYPSVLLYNGQTPPLAETAA